MFTHGSICCWKPLLYSWIFIGIIRINHLPHRLLPPVNAALSIDTYAYSIYFLHQAVPDRGHNMALPFVILPSRHIIWQGTAIWLHLQLTESLSSGLQQVLGFNQSLGCFRNPFKSRWTCPTRGRRGGLLDIETFNRFIFAHYYWGWLFVVLANGFPWRLLPKFSERCPTWEVWRWRDIEIFQNLQLSRPLNPPYWPRVSPQHHCPSTCTAEQVMAPCNMKISGELWILSEWKCGDVSSAVKSSWWGVQVASTLVTRSNQTPVTISIFT